MSIENLSLEEDEASELAEDLKRELNLGVVPASDKKRIQLIIAGLGDSRGLVRRTFIESLGVIGKPALPLLQKALIKHPNVTVRRAAAKALKLVADPIALPDLLEALINDSDPVVQGSSVSAIAMLGEPAVTHLLKVLINPNSSAMQCGLSAWGLSLIGAEAAKALRDAAQSKNAVIKAAAISALRQQIQAGDEKAKALVTNALDDKVIEVRIEATCLLGMLDDSEWAKSLLINKLSDISNDVRKKAAISLMKLRAIEALDIIKKRYSIEKDLEVIDILKLVINQLSEKS